MNLKALSGQTKSGWKRWRQCTDRVWPWRRPRRHYVQLWHYAGLLMIMFVWSNLYPRDGSWALRPRKSSRVLWKHAIRLRAEFPVPEETLYVAQKPRPDYIFCLVMAEAMLETLFWLSTLYLFGDKCQDRSGQVWVYAGTARPCTIVIGFSTPVIFKWQITHFSFEVNTVKMNFLARKWWQWWVKNSLSCVSRRS